MTALAWIVARTPLPVAAAFAGLVSWLWWFVVPVRRRLAEGNFRTAFPGRPPGPPLRRMASGLVLGYFELLHEVGRPGTVRFELEGEGVDPIRERSSQGEGTLLLAGHLGSWDLAGPLAAQRSGLKVTAVAKVPQSRNVAAFMEEARKAFGLGLLEAERGLLPRVCQLLAEGQVVVFHLDQRHKEGIFVPFFGRPAVTAPGLAAVAARTGVPVFFLEYRREGTGRHAARVSGPIPTTGRVEDDTALFNRWIEEAVRRRPHGWFWLHDRWKGADRAPADAEA